MANFMELEAFRPLSGESADGLGDRRRHRRHGAILDALSRSSAASFPRIFSDKAALEGFYRFVENDSFTDVEVLQGHVDETMRRAESQELMLVVHDSTSVRYPLLDDDWLRENLSRPSTQTQGYELHASLLLTGDEQGAPLGLGHAAPYVHEANIAYDDDVRAWWAERGGVFDSEAKRWFDGVEHVAKSLGERSSQSVHLMDREGDHFSLLHWLVHEGHRFVIRAKHLNRAIERNGSSEAKTVSEALAQAPFVGEVEAHLGFRSPFRNQKKRKTHPPRKGRTATLSARAAHVNIRRSRIVDIGYTPLDPSSLPKSIPVSAVELVERVPPEGQTPVRWVLLTSEPIDSPEDILHVINAYRRRWVIEEFFKALKTGCALEKRQMDSAERLLKVLALLIPVAWSLLLTRALEDRGHNLPWGFLLSPLGFSILRKARPKDGLDDDATAAQVLNAIAGLGGHLKHNGPPGWITLQRGMQTLETLIWGARIAQHAQDQM